MSNRVDQLIELLQLQSHPEGGYFKEKYRSNQILSDLPGFSGDRHVATSIYFLLTSENFSAFHKIKQDEIWHFYEGSTIELHTISEEGTHEIHLIGSQLEKGEHMQWVVPAHYWFAAKVVEPESYALVGCTVSPGFDFDDFTLAKRDSLVKLFPKHEKVIRAFTRD